MDEGLQNEAEMQKLAASQRVATGPGREGQVRCQGEDRMSRMKGAETLEMVDCGSRSPGRDDGHIPFSTCSCLHPGPMGTLPFSQAVHTALLRRGKTC